MRKRNLSNLIRSDLLKVATQKYQKIKCQMIKCRIIQYTHTFKLGLQAKNVNKPG